MAQTNDNKGAESGSLADDFSFSDNSEWFGQKAGDDEGTTVREVKGSTTGGKSEKEVTQIREGVSDDDDEDDLNPAVEEQGDGENEDFFGIKKEGQKKETPKNTKPTKKETVKEEEDNDDDEEEEEDDNVEFSQKNANKAKKGTKEDESTNDEPEEDDKEFYTTLSKELVEKGVFKHIEVKDGDEITVEKFFELQDEELEARVDEAIEAMAENLDQDGKDLLKFIQKGGKPSKYLSIYQNDIALDTFNPDNKKQVEQVLRHHLSKVQGMDEEEVVEQIAFWKEGGKDVAKAQKFFDDIKAKKEQLKEQILTAQAEAARKQKESERLFDEQLKDTLAKTDKVGTIPISDKDKKELAKYINFPIVKAGKNSFIPQFDADLNKIMTGKTKEDRQKMAAIAKILKADFDLKELETQAATKVTKVVKSNIKEARSNPKKSSSGSSRNRSLADFF